MSPVTAAIAAVVAEFAAWEPPAGFTPLTDPEARLVSGPLRSGKKTYRDRRTAAQVVPYHLGTFTGAVVASPVRLFAAADGAVWGAAVIHGNGRSSDAPPFVHFAPLYAGTGWGAGDRGYTLNGTDG